MKLQFLCVLVVLGSVACFACAADDGAATKVTQITLTRSGDGTGKGPEDVLTLRADGSAEYVGTKNVERIGSYTGTLPDFGWKPSFPLLAKMYEALREQRGSTGKPTQTVTAITWSVVRDGKTEELDDLCPGLDPTLWAFEMAVRGVGADVAWKKAAPPPQGAPPQPQGKNDVKLKLAPAFAAADEPAIAALTANRWTLNGDVNILGASWAQTLRFTRLADGKLSVEAVMHREPGVNAHARIPDVVETDECEVKGPVLRRGETPQTFVVSGKYLVMNALAPAGEGCWYYAAAERDGKGSPARVEEYQFRFADDPLKTDAGQGSMKVRIGAYPPKPVDFHYKLTRSLTGLRYIDILTDGPSGSATRARIALAAGGEYGLMLDNLNLNSEVFTAN